MAAPQTGFEATGTWTPTANDAAFWDQCAADTALTYATAGYSQGGKPIYRVDLGTPTAGTLMVTSLVHANEPATREALLAFMRDMAYSTDTAVTGYLATHRITAVVPGNPDGAFGNRLTANGVNINRDMFALSAPETRAIATVARQAAPDVMLDLHEYWSENDTHWTYRGGGHPITHPAIQSLEQAAVQHQRADVTAAGFTGMDFGTSYLPRASISVVAGLIHAVGLLSETNAVTRHPAAQRVAINRMVLDSTWEWHRDNAAACKDAAAQSRQAANTTNPDHPLYTLEYIGADTSPEILAVAGYRPSGAIPQAHLDTFGIQVDASGFISMYQDAQPVIPTLLDPSSPDAVVAATRVARLTPLPDKPLVGFRVGVDGSSRPVVAIKHRVGGETKNVLVP